MWKLLGAGTTAAGVTLLNDWSVQFVGVQLTVIAMAVIGSLVSFAYGEPVKSKRKLYVYALASTFVATIGVALFPPMLGWEWVTPKLQAPLAGLLAFSGRFSIPVAIDLMPEVLRKVFRLEKKEEKDEPTK